MREVPSAARSIERPGPVHLTLVQTVQDLVEPVYIQACSVALLVAGIGWIEVGKVPLRRFFQGRLVILTHEPNPSQSSRPGVHDPAESVRVHALPREMERIVELSVAIETDDSVHAGAHEEAQVGRAV